MIGGSFYFIGEDKLFYAVSIIVHSSIECSAG